MKPGIFPIALFAVELAAIISLGACNLTLATGSNTTPQVIVVTATG
jgi:hypothetical protein